MNLVHRDPSSNSSSRYVNGFHCAFAARLPRWSSLSTPSDRSFAMEHLQCLLPLLAVRSVCGILNALFDLSVSSRRPSMKILPSIFLARTKDYTEVSSAVTPWGSRIEELRFMGFDFHDGKCQFS